jgi:hypothetical protein
MRLSIEKTYRIAIAAACSLGLVGTAAAQGTTRADQRIPVNVKDAGGTVELIRVDTVLQFRTDTLRLYRTDTLRVPGPTVTNTVTRFDTVMVETLPGWMHRPNGMYFGLGGGVAIPSGAIGTAQANGYAFQAHVGVDPAGSPLGLRLDANWARYDDENPYKNNPDGSNRARPEVINVGANLKLRLPTLSQRFPLAPYLTGGGNYIYYKDLLIQVDPQAGLLENNVAPSDGNWHDKWGYNLGAGFTLGWGKTELFVESRLIDFKPANASVAKQLPIMIGINWY